jgi:hypothetical protein
MTTYESALTRLQQIPKTWLITGGCGFIGANFIRHGLESGLH